MSKPKTENTVRLMVHLSPRTRAQLEQIALARETTRAAIIRDLIRAEAARLGLSPAPAAEEASE